MKNKARDLILKLYKDDKITKEEVDILLDAIGDINRYYTFPKPYPYWEYKPAEQPYYTITNNIDKTNVE